VDGLSVTTQTMVGTTVVTVSGTCGTGSLDALRTRLSADIAEGTGPVLVDLSGLLDWTPPLEAALVHASIEAGRRGRWLGFFGMAHDAVEALHAAGLAAYVHAYDTASEAVANIPDSALHDQR